MASWLLLVSHLCVEAGAAHAVSALIPAHSTGDSDDGHAAVHADCGSALLSSADRDPLPAPAGPDLSGSSALAAPSSRVLAPAAMYLPTTDATRARSAPPLYLLHAAFLI